MTGTAKRNPVSQAGLSMVELVIFIVVVSIGITGVLSVLNVTTRSSANPMIRKQVLSIGEAMLDEILAKDYQNDTSDPTNTSATLGCTPSTTPSCRTNNVADRPNYNDVSDYNGWNQTGVTDVSGASVTGLSTYTVAVTVGAAAAWNGTPAKLVTVTVTKGSESISLSGYRTNYD